MDLHLLSSIRLKGIPRENSVLIRHIYFHEPFWCKNKKHVVVPVYTVEAYWGSGGITPFMYNLSTTRYRISIKFRPLRSVYTGEVSPTTPWLEGLVGQVLSVREKSCACWASDYDSRVVRPVGYSLCQLIDPGFFVSYAINCIFFGPSHVSNKMFRPEMYIYILIVFNINRW